MEFMCNSIIEFLVDAGDIHDRIDRGKEYKKSSEKCSELYDSLKGSLNEEQFKIFNDYVDGQMLCESEANIAYFKAGVKFAVRFMCECMN